MYYLKCGLICVGRQIPGQSWAVLCPSQVLPTASVLSDDRGELREIAMDRYGADTLFLQDFIHVYISYYFIIELRELVMRPQKTKMPPCWQEY